MSKSSSKKKTLHAKQKVFSSITKGLEEVSDARKSGSELQSLSDFLKELEIEKR
ncbi:MAG: hypothetical protein ABI723_12635 [Bacteroidia bacterium]